jgi:5-methylcytosine-specific restriction endonuclease McrA
METKICSKCGREYPVTNDYFKWRDKAKGTLETQCKGCTVEYARQYRADNKGALAEYNKQWRLDNAEYAKQYYLGNKEAITERTKKYRLDHKEANAERHKKYRLDHKEAGAEYAKQYNLANKEAVAKHKKQYRLVNKETVAEYRKQYYQGHPEEYRIYVQRRNAKVRNLPYALTVLQWEETKEYFDNKCCYCNREVPLAQDHFVPVDKGGWYVKNNIIPTCKSCNSSKYNHDGLEWFTKQTFYSKKREAKIIKYLGYTKNVQQMAFI